MTVRGVLSTGLAVYCVGIVVLSLWPTDTITWVELVVAALAAAAFIGIVAAATPIDLPREEWAYLLTGAAGLYTLIEYVWLSSDPGHIVWAVALLLGSGVIAAYGAHLAIPPERN